MRTSQPDQFCLQFSGEVGGGEAVYPLGGGGEGDSVASLAGSDGQPYRQVRFSSTRRTQKYNIVFRGHKIERA